MSGVFMMKKTYFIILIAAVALFFSACSRNTALLGPKREAVSHEEFVIDTGEYPKIDITADSCSLHVYSWKEKKVKFEATKRVRGMQPEEDLQKALKNFSISIDHNEERVKFISDYKKPIKNPADIGLSLNVYLPAKTESIFISIDTGKIKFYDDVNCLLKAEIGMANLEINRFEGVIDCSMDMGDVRINSGELKAGSRIRTNMGNINVKAKVFIPGEYLFRTGLGNIDLEFDKGAALYVESVGNLRVNEFEDSSPDVKIQVRSDMGRINIKKY